MKTLHINSYYIGSKLYKNFCDKQIELGLDIDVFVPVSNSFNLSTVTEENHVTISPNFNKFERLFFNLKHHKIYKDIMKKKVMKNYSIIHAHSLFSNGYIAMKLKKKYGIPYVVAVRNTDVNIFFKYMIHLRKLGIDILREASKVIFLSNPYKNLIIEKYVPTKFKMNILAKSEVIPNGIDDYWFSNKRFKINKKNSDGKRIKLLYVGSINKNKNILMVIKAIDILIHKGFDVTYTIVGKVEDNSVYKKIENLPYVKYIKNVPKEELINIYRLNDIFIMPSKYETFGLVYPESMSQGLPVIYSKGQGFDGQFREGEVGYHVDSSDANDIAGKIMNIKANYNLLSKNCLNHVSEFKWELLVQQYSILYKEIVKKTKK